MSEYYLLQFPFIPHDNWEPVEVERAPDEPLTTCMGECMGYVRIINDTLRKDYCQKFQTEGECTDDFTKYILRKNAENPIESSDLIDISEFIDFFSKHLYKNYITIVGLHISGGIGHSVTVYKDNSNNIWIIDPQMEEDYVCILNPEVEEENRTDTITDYLNKYYRGFSVYVQNDKRVPREENEFEPGKKQKISHSPGPAINPFAPLFSMGKPSKTINNRKKHKITNKKKKVGNGKTKKQKTKPKTKKQKPKNLKIR